MDYHKSDLSKLLPNGSLISLEQRNGLFGDSDWCLTWRDVSLLLTLELIAKGAGEAVVVEVDASERRVVGKVRDGPAELVEGEVEEGEAMHVDGGAGYAG